MKKFIFCIVALFAVVYSAEAQESKSTAKPRYEQVGSHHSFSVSTPYRLEYSYEHVWNSGMSLIGRIGAGSEIYSPYENYSVINIVEKEGVISFSFVGEAELSVDEEISMAAVVMVKRNGVCELEGVSSGAMVYCFDAVGRRLWSRTVLTEPFNFVEPQGFYLLKIEDKSVEFVLKGI